MQVNLFFLVFFPNKGRKRTKNGSKAAPREQNQEKKDEVLVNETHTIHTNCVEMHMQHAFVPGIASDKNSFIFSSRICSCHHHSFHNGQILLQVVRKDIWYCICKQYNNPPIGKAMFGIYMVISKGSLQLVNEGGGGAFPRV